MKPAYLGTGRFKGASVGGSHPPTFQKSEFWGTGLERMVVGRHIAMSIITYIFITIQYYYCYCY
jgi:hypothetical protein